MTQLLTVAQLQAIGLVNDPGLLFASRSHLLPLTAAEASQAACDVPVLVSRNSNDGSLMMSALCSFIPNSNLLVQHDAWQAVYRPLAMQSYPCVCLLNNQQAKPAFLADPSAYSADAPSLFNTVAEPTPQAHQLMQIATSMLAKERETYLLLQRLEHLKLFRPIELQLQAEHGAIQRIRGLLTVNEDQLYALDATQLKQLQHDGVLPLLYSMLNSLLQLNRLVQLHNQRASQQVSGYQHLRHLRIEVDRDSGF